MIGRVIGRTLINLIPVNVINAPTPRSTKASAFDPCKAFLVVLAAAEGRKSR
jgi:hypothetical protein|eukprot:COSAG01_NODE_2696_length_7240_cov_16.574989_6_plen_52_part_00